MNLNLKSLAMAGTCAVTLLAGANAMAWGSAWTDGLGRTHYNFGGRTGTSWSDGLGRTHYNFGGRTGTSWTDGLGRTHFNGDLFRGGLYRDDFGDIRDTGDPFFRIKTRGQQLAKKLFVDEDFAKRIDVIAMQEAIISRDAEAIASSAWDLKGLELTLGKTDKKTNSSMLFAAAADLAVKQGNADALKKIIVLAPECKKYEEQLALKGKTRGLNKSATALPQLVVLQGKDWQKVLTSLQAWEQPALDRYICSSFRGMTPKSADTASMLVNEGRLTMNPQMIAMGALELSKYSYDNKLGSKFDPAQIFAESAELAIDKQDAEALKQISALYGTANFKTDEFAKYLNDEIALLGSTRGRDNYNDEMKLVGEIYVLIGSILVGLANM